MFSTTKWLQQNKVAICLYLYHTDLWDEFRTLLLPIKDHIKLYIGLCEENPIVNDLDLFDHHITWHKNYGVDVAPFLHQLGIINEKLFIKLHSKKSLWGFKQHIPWRYLIVNDFIGSKKIFKKNIKTILSDNYGILCNKFLHATGREFLNAHKIKEVCSIINMDYGKIKNSGFVAGNMFMGKTKIFQEALLNHIPKIDNLLKTETGQVSDKYVGRYAHSMEQIFGYICTYYGYEFCYPKHKAIKILNKEAKNKKYFHLIKTYNNDCYLLEDPNVYGTYSFVNDKQCKITWYHMDQPVNQNYRILEKDTIIKITD